MQRWMRQWVNGGSRGVMLQCSKNLLIRKADAREFWVSRRGDEREEGCRKERKSKGVRMRYSLSRRSHMPHDV